MPDENEPLSRLKRPELQERLTKAIRSLPDRERLVLTLYYYEELTTEEIELVLGETKSSVFHIHTSALLHLHSVLAESMGGESGKS
jgi:RNA polymerase sigma factor for flagellar operon FliA